LGDGISLHPQNGVLAEQVAQGDSVFFRDVEGQEAGLTGPFAAHVLSDPFDKGYLPVLSVCRNLSCARLLISSSCGSL